MKLPYVSVKLEYRDDESFALGKMSWPLIVGFAAHWLWVYLAMFSSDALFGAAPAAIKLVLYGGSLAVFSSTFLCYGIFLDFARKLFQTPSDRRRNRAVAAVSVFVGTLLFAFAGLPGAAGTVCAVISALLTGFGSAVLLMSYGVSFSVCDVPTSTMSAALALTLSLLGFVSVLALDSVAHPAGAVICLSLPFVELACLNRCSAQLVDRLEFMSLTLPVNLGAFAVRMLLPNLVLGFALGVFRFTTFSCWHGSPFTASGAAVVIMSGVAVFVMIAVSLVRRHEKASFLFRAFLPVVAVLLTLPSFVGGGNSLFLVFALSTSYLILEICAWVYCADISQRFRISPFSAVGFGRGALSLGTLAGSFLMYTPIPAARQLVDDIPTAAMVTLASIIVGVSLLPKSAEILGTLKRGSTCPAFYSPDEPISAAAPSGNGKASAVAEGSVSVSADAAQDLPAGESAVGADGGADVLDGAARREEACAGARRDAGRFKRKCALTAETYLLSRRETEVLFLLAKGYNSSAIQEQLFISSGTVNTHMRHIYRKLDIHSQQELIAVVDSMEG